jgi:hypothetical protein
MYVKLNIVALSREVSSVSQTAVKLEESFFYENLMSPAIIKRIQVFVLNSRHFYPLLIKYGFSRWIFIT